jgi:hypothetical protein
MVTAGSCGVHCGAERESDWRKVRWSGMTTIIKKGHADWDDLKGKRITFDWTDGYEDFYPAMTFSRTQVYADDPRYPRYYILDENGGGYSVWEDEEVEVTVLE